MPNPVTVPQRRPSTPDQVHASAARYAANNGGVALGRANFSDLHPSLQKKITDQFGIPQAEWDNPNSYHATLLGLQLGAAEKDSNNMKFQTYASDYKRFAGNPQKTKALDTNIGWDRKNQKWLPHKDDLVEGSPGYVPPAVPSPAPSPSPTPAPMGAVGSAPMGAVGSAPMGAVGSAPAPIAPSAAPAPAPMADKQGSAMTNKQMFKVAFLAKCIEDGLTIDEIKVRVKQALHVVEKKANTYAAIADLIRTVPLLGLGAGSLIAGGGYYGGKNIIGPGIHEAFKAPLPDKEDLLKEEVINEYDRQAETIKRQAELTRRRRERDRGMSGITRY